MYLQQEVKLTVVLYLQSPNSHSAISNPFPWKNINIIIDTPGSGVVSYLPDHGAYIRW